ncbi:glycosyltransferase family 2 protein [Hyphobacterium sp. CCMP332]|nr:glycosyltransferase family 2 protein [Hyphobacterium sp. CCMP332]
MIVDVIIPAYNEQDSVGLVIGDIPKDLVREIIVVNNASNDKTPHRAENAGATVLFEAEKGYGAACLKGMEYIKAKGSIPDVIVFLDADYSDHPEEMPLLLNEIKNGANLVIGSRALGKKEKGSMTIQQIFGNWLATLLMKYIYGIKFTDLGPFRAIKWDALQKIDMKDRNWGWTVEMQVKAGKQNLKCSEIPVTYRRRIGVSKVSGTLKGTLMAGYKIIYTIFKYR